MPTIADVYHAINALHSEGVVEDYAIGGGMAALFYAETTLTFDVDVFVLIPQSGLLIDLSPIYDWARTRNYEVRDEYLVMHGVPVQILIASPGLETEAIENANIISQADVPVRVMKPEYLIALYIKTGGDKRRGRARDLFAEESIDKTRLKDVLTRFDLLEKWRQNGGEEL
ncbi:MAG TPA: hypothetical protein VF627_06580 [Abditibacterium sp.]|jgi:hypothetical protein